MAGAPVTMSLILFSRLLIALTLFNEGLDGFDVFEGLVANLMVGLTFSTTWAFVTDSSSTSVTPTGGGLNICGPSSSSASESENPGGSGPKPTRFHSIN